MKNILVSLGAAALALSVAAPANATFWGSSSRGGCTKSCSSSTGGSTSTSTGGSSTGGSSGSTSVPEPGQLGLFAAGAILLAARRFRRKG